MLFFRPSLPKTLQIIRKRLRQKRQRIRCAPACANNGRESITAEDRGSSPTPGTAAVRLGTVREDAGDREIKLELNRVERGERKPGRLVRVELRTSADQSASFTVTRSADNLHLSTEAKLGLQVHSGRVLPVRNRSAAQLLSREMEILCNDKIYQEALALAITLIDLSRSVK